MLQILLTLLRCPILVELYEIANPPSVSFLTSILMPMPENINQFFKAVNSILTQSICFEESIQLFLLESDLNNQRNKICYAFQRKFPQNIITTLLSDAGNVNSSLYHDIRGHVVLFYDYSYSLKKRALENIFQDLHHPFHTHRSSLLTISNTTIARPELLMSNNILTAQSLRSRENILWRSTEINTYHEEQAITEFINRNLSRYFRRNR